jgi:hypothetical protein
MTFDPSGDFLAVVDGLTTVTLKNRAGVTVATPSALRRQISNRELDNSGGRYKAGDVRFHFEQAGAGVGPDLGGTITDAAGVWTIVAFENATLSTRWACVCRKANLPSGALVSVERATYAKGTTGAQEPSWSVVYENIAGYVHTEGADRDVEHERRHNRRSGTAWLANAVDLEPNDRIVDAEGVRWRVVEWKRPELGELMAVTVEEGPWPFA